MSLLTLAHARTALWRYGPHAGVTFPGSPTQRAEFDAALNQVIEQLLINGKPRNTVRKVRIPIYDGCITLPRHLLSCNGVKLLDNDDPTESCGYPLLVYSAFHEFFHGPCPTCSCDGGAMPVSTLAQTFRDSAAGFTLRVKSTEAHGAVTFLGGTGTDDKEFFDPVVLNVLAGSATTIRTWNTLPQIQKSLTNFKIELYSVIAGAETLLAIYAPGETVPAYARYAVTSEDSTTTTALAQCKLAFVPVVAESDIVYPGIIRALRAGLDAVDREVKKEWNVARDLWADAQQICDLDRQQIDGDHVSEVRVLRGMSIGDFAHTV